MEIFKTDALEKRIWKISKRKLSWNIEVWLLSKDCLRILASQILSCKFCKEASYKPCHNFNIAKEIILKEVDPIGKDFIENFITDFLCISNKTLETNFQISEVVHSMDLIHKVLHKALHKIHRKNQKFIM